MYVRLSHCYSRRLGFLPFPLPHTTTTFLQMYSIVRVRVVVRMSTIIDYRTTHSLFHHRKSHYSFRGAKLTRSDPRTLDDDVGDAFSSSQSPECFEFVYIRIHISILQSLFILFSHKSP